MKELNWDVLLPQLEALEEGDQFQVSIKDATEELPYKRWYFITNRPYTKASIIFVKKVEIDE